MARKVKNIYADNTVILPVVTEYVLMYRQAKEAGLPAPRMPEKLGKVIWDIADGLAKRPNFSGYTYIDDMKMDGVEDCIKYAHNFNIDKYDKPYSYFNRIIWQAFLRRIEKEKKQQYIAYTIGHNGMGGDDIYITHTHDMDDKFQALIDKFEPKKKGIEKFV